MKDMKRSTQKKETKKRTKLLDSRIIQKSAKALQRNNKKKEEKNFQKLNLSWKILSTK